MFSHESFSRDTSGDGLASRCVIFIGTASLRVCLVVEPLRSSRMSTSGPRLAHWKHGCWRSHFKEGQKSARRLLLQYRTGIPPAFRRHLLFATMALCTRDYEPLTFSRQLRLLSMCLSWREHSDALDKVKSQESGCGGVQAGNFCG